MSVKREIDATQRDFPYYRKQQTLIFDYIFE